MKNLQRPKSLHKGATIGVVSPSYWLDETTLNKSLKLLKNNKYIVKVGGSVRQKDGILAGTAESRATDIMTMFCDPKVDAIICVRGGYGANRVMPLLDYDLIRSNPKIFIGFSDITCLLNAIASKANLTTFHGPMLSTLGRTPNDFNWQQMESVLSGSKSLSIDGIEDCMPKALIKGQAVGQLVGGNLSLITEAIGTENEIDMSNKLVLIEEVGEKLYRFDRMMLQLKNSGSLDNAKGIIFGEMTEMQDTEVPFGKSLDEIILDSCAELDIPIITNFPAGHGEYICTLPIGHEVSLLAEDGKSHVLINQSPVIK